MAEEPEVVVDSSEPDLTVETAELAPRKVEPAPPVAKAATLRAADALDVPTARGRRRVEKGQELPADVEEDVVENLKARSLVILE